MYRWQFYAIAIVFFIAYVVIQSRIFLFPPSLAIYSPEVIQARAGEEVIIFGKTNRINRVLFNGEVILLDSSGGFSQRVTIQKGITPVELEASNRFGRTHQKMITIIAKE